MKESDTKSTNLPSKEFTEPNNPQNNDNEKEQTPQSPKSSKSELEQTSIPKSPHKSPRKSPRKSGDRVKYKPQDLDNITKIIKERKRMERIQKDITEKLSIIAAFEKRFNKTTLSKQDTDNDKSSKSTTNQTPRNSVPEDAEAESQITTITRRSQLSKTSKKSNASKANKILLDAKELNLLKLRSTLTKRRFVLRGKGSTGRQPVGARTSHLPVYQREKEKKPRQFKKKA
eukprot:augustus_masked-scaffold_4-processed-gene-9.46-mRNA-1 protein AED:1.00 eAED:1.00 QI:0/0/0/0/1/1/2/0/229